MAKTLWAANLALLKLIKPDPCPTRAWERQAAHCRRALPISHPDHAGGLRPNRRPAGCGL